LPTGPLRTMPTAGRSSSSDGRRRTGSSPAIRPSSREPSSGSLASRRRRAASSPAPMPSPSPSRRSPISKRRSTPTSNCPRRSLSTSPRPPEARSSPRCARASGTAPALLSVEGCLFVTYRQFRTFFPLGAVFLSIAVVVLFMRRTKIPAVPISKPARKAGARQ